jgi:hypothetical protein
LTNDQQFADNARYYSTPGLHFQYIYYSGVPVQSIAPVRLSFLESYPGEIVYFDYLGLDKRWTVDKVLNDAQANGYFLPMLEAKKIAKNMAIRDSWLRLDSRVATTFPGPTSVPNYLREAYDSFEQSPASRVSWSTDALIFRGFDIVDNDGAWAVFFYRFVNPLSRLKFFLQSPRLKRAHVVELKDGLVVYRSPPLD